MSLYKKVGAIKSNLQTNLSKLDRNNLISIKSMHREKIDYEYSSNFCQDMQYNEMELHLFNHKGWIVGYQDDDFTSADHLLSRCSLRQPKGILLGNCSINDFDYYDKGYDKYKLKEFIDKVSGESLIGRQLFLDFFRNKFPVNMNYYKDMSDYTVSEIDTLYKRKVFDANLTLAYFGCFREQTKIIFSSPNKLLNLEDLVINNSLEDLQMIFVQAIEEYRLRSKDILPILTPPEFTMQFRRIVQEMFTDKIYDKKCQYSAAVFRKIHKLYPNNILFMPHHLVPKTYEHITDTFCPEFDEIYRNKNFKNKLSTVKSDMATLKEILEKLAILGYLFDAEFSRYLIHGSNPLKVMFAGLFGKYSDEKVLNIFNNISRMYQIEMENLFFEQLKNIENTMTSGRNWTKDYVQELKVYERDTEFSKFIPPNEFLIDRYKKEEEMKFIHNLLLVQIGLNINMHEKNGKNLNITKSLLNQYFSGYKTKQNTQLFEELLVEANARLGLLKLPSNFRKYEMKLNEILYTNMEEMLGENPNHVYEKAISKIYNQLQGIDQLVIKDGSESPLTESIIEKIKNNKLKLNDLSPLFISSNLIKKQKNENLQHSQNFKSISISKYKNSVIKKASESIILKEKSDDSNNLINDDECAYDISEESEKDRDKLELIHDIHHALKEDKKSLITMGGDININDLSNKSIEELKKLDIEEVAKYNFQEDEQGHVNFNLISSNDSELQTLEREMTTGKNHRVINIDQLNPEKNFFSVYDKISNDLYKKDKIRVNKITNALTRGEYLDDPIYVQLLMTEDRFIRLREKFLKTYFTSGNNESVVNKMPLLDKYAKMPGDIVQNMIKDNVYYKYDHKEGKIAFNLYNQLFEDIDKEELVDEQEDPDKLGIDFIQEQEEDDDVVNNFHEFIKDKISELSVGGTKKLYLENVIADKKLDNKNNNITSGRQIDNRNKKNKHLKYL